MSYILINGKRHYKDDATGEVSIDNVSQSVADQRALYNYNRPVVRTMKNNTDTVLNKLIDLFNRMIHVITLFFIVGSLLLTTAYYIREQPQFRNPLRMPEVYIQLHSTSELEQRIIQVGERFNELISSERRR